VFWFDWSFDWLVGLKFWGVSNMFLGVGWLCFDVFAFWRRRALTHNTPCMLPQKQKQKKTSAYQTNTKQQQQPRQKQQPTPLPGW
jgi:hypothetical protein